MTGVVFPDFVDPLKIFLDKFGYVVLHGGLATELELAHGADLKDPLWSAKILIENSEMIQKVHESYIRAGADIITTATYQASFGAFEQKGINEIEAKRLFISSVKLARQAIQDAWSTMSEGLNTSGVSYSASLRRYRPIVAGSLGPYGSYEGSEFKGNYGKTVEELMDFHRPRMLAILEAEPDLIICETVPCANEEAEALARIFKEDLNICNAPAIVSFSCQDGSRTCCGESLAEGVKKFEGIVNVVAVGINCTSPMYISDLIKQARSVTTKPIIVYPNSGETWDTQHFDWKGCKCANFDCKVEEWYSLGARIFGGCCRTNPEDIRTIRAALESKVTSDRR